MQRLIEEERKKKERLQLEDQQHRRHSDYAPIKSPIITNERFNDPIISSKEGPQPGRKQEVKIGLEGSSRWVHQFLSNLGLILGLRASSVRYHKTLGRIEPILSSDELLVLTQERINPSVLWNQLQGLGSSVSSYF